MAGTLNHKGVLTVVSGFSGAGKGTLMKLLIERYQNYALSISATTRSPRCGEEDGKDYFFLTRDEFKKLIADDDLIEYNIYEATGDYYGTPRKYVAEQLEHGKDVILEIDVNGAAKVKAQFPDALLIFVTPPSAEELKRRLVGRASEAPDKVAKRLRTAVEESKWMSTYDYILVNDVLEDALKELHTAIQNEHRKGINCEEFIERITTELKELNAIGDEQ